MKTLDRLKTMLVGKNMSGGSMGSSYVGREVKTKSEINDYAGMAISDGLVNIASALGTHKDKDRYSEYTLDTLKSWATLINAYRTSWVCAKIVDIPAEEMTREWRKFTMQDPLLQEAMLNADIKFNVKALFRQAIKWGRLFGGAVIFIGTDDGDLRYPLELDRLKQGSLKFLRVLDNRIVYPLNMGNVYNPSSHNFMDPEYYLISNNYGDERTEIAQEMHEVSYVMGEIGRAQPVIHKSRIIRFDGVPLPLIEFLAMRGWGDSVLNRMFSAVSHLDTVHNAIATMVHEANIDIFKIKDLASILKSPTGQGRVQTRITTNSFFKSLINMFVIDKENEEIERKPISFGTLDTILEKNLSICAAAADIPATRLIGSSPDGMNATGASDIRNFYDSIRSSQEEIMREKLKYLDKIIALSELGFIPDDLKFDFNPLWQMSDKEKTEIQVMKAGRDTAYLSAGVVTPSIIAEQLQIDETYAGIDDEALQELEEMGAPFTEEELLENAQGNENVQENENSETNSTEEGEFNAGSVEKVSEVNEFGVGNETKEKPPKHESQ